MNFEKNDFSYLRHMNSNSIVLDQDQIRQKTERIALEILENTFEDANLYMAGICGNGQLFAERLITELKKHSQQKINLFEVKVNKKQPLSEPIQFSIDAAELEGQTVILVDDVINSGLTLIHSAAALLTNDLKALKVATLVNRTHRRFPVKADFVGLNVSTTLQDNIIVEFGDREVAYLS